MKKLQFAILALAIALVACKKEEPTPVNTNSSGGGSTSLKPFALNLDGTDYETATTFSQSFNGIVSIQATVGSNLNFSLTIPDTAVVGSYSIDGTNPFSIGHTDDSYATYYQASSGNFTIVTHDTISNEISGTFSGTLLRSSDNATKTVTSGEFNVTYP